MKFKRILKIAIIVLGVIISGLIIYFVVGIASLRFISDSHIEGNVPEKSQFDELLSRDLGKYFSEKFNKQIIVKYELLRDGPTQVGVALPKYYAWVVIYDNDNELEQGAVRLAAVEKESFQIFNYVSFSEITINPEIIFKIFPLPVAEEIKEKMRNL